MLRFFAALLLAPSLFGQSTSSLSWSAKNIHSIQLTLPFANQIKIIGEKRSSIKIDYQTEGEYQKELRLKSEEINHELRLEEQLAPSFTPYHDKLSAHKVMASTLTLWLPERISLSLQIQNAKSTISGKISSLSVKQIEGNLHLDAIDAKGHLYTQKAIIQVHQSKQKVFASSKNGRLNGFFSSEDEAQLFLQSRDGDISIISDRN